MSYLRTGILAASIAALAIVDGVDASVRKCSVPVQSPPVVMIDGKVMGDYVHPATPGADQGPGGDAFHELKSGDIHEIRILCLDLPEGGAVIKKQVISVVTKGGIPAMLKSYLDELVGQQEEYRQTNGKYSEGLTELAFFNSRPPLPIEMKATEAGWSATAQIAGQSTICHVAIGTGEPARAELQRGVVGCFGS